MGEIKRLVLFSLVFILFVDFGLAVLPPGDWWGTVEGLNDTEGATVTAYIDSEEVASTRVDGEYYLIHVPGEEGDEVNFEVNGYPVAQDSQDWSMGDHHLDLQVNTTEEAEESGGATQESTGTGGSSEETGTGGGYGGYMSREGMTRYIWSPWPDLEPGNQTKIAYGDGDLNLTLKAANKITSESSISVQGSHEKPEGIKNVSEGREPYLYLNITPRNLTDEDLESVKFEFKVNKSWFGNKSLDPETVSLNRYDPETTSWEKIETERIGETDRYYIYQAETGGFSIYAVLAEEINEAPEANFSYAPQISEVGELVTFDASASRDDEGIESYLWEFGDNSTGSGKTVTYSYDKEGNYKVVLTVKDQAGKRDNKSIRVSIERQECPSCPEPSDWSKCINRTMTRTRYRCSEKTNYTCEAYTKSINCEPLEEAVCGNNECEEGENYTTCSQDCKAPGITGRIISSTAGQGAIVVGILILTGIGFYFFRKK